MDAYHPTIHELKTWPQWFTQIQRGDRTFELRKNDRNFHVSDLLILREYDPDIQTYTGYAICAVVTCVVSGEWLADGYVALGIRVLQ